MDPDDSGSAQIGNPFAAPQPWKDRMAKKA
jgi:hypothetical protein